MSGRLHSGMTDDQKMADRSEHGAPRAATGGRKVVIEGLKAKNANFFGESCYHDHRHNRQGPARFPENMRPADHAPVETTLVLRDVDVGDNPTIAARHGYFDHTTRDASSGTSGQ